MVVRQIIRIDEVLCTGCGQCIPNCPEGALQIIDGKARMISDLFCDGLGACMGHCPEGAITIEEREAEEYDERRVMENVVKQGPNVIEAHLEHMKEHNQTEYLGQAIDYLKESGIEVPAGFDDNGKAEPLPCGCPSTAVKQISPVGEDEAGSRPSSQLGNWPVQIMLVPPNAPYLQGASLLIAADCTAFACASLHQDFIRGKVALIGCPKLDNAEFYIEKLAETFRLNDIKDVTIAIREVPCCSGLSRLVEEAVKGSGKAVPLEVKVIGINGDLKKGIGQ
jgi:ferredoxin